MCGIFGLISRRGNASPVLSEMSDLIRHRGPDGEGFAIFTPGRTAAIRGGVDTPSHLYNAQTPYAPERPLTREDQHGARVALGHRRLAIVDLSEFGHQPMCSSDRSDWIVYNGEVYNHVELQAELEALGHRFPSHSDTAVILAAYREWGVDCLRRFNGMFCFVLYDQAKDRMFLARDRFGVKPLNMWSNGETFAFASEVKAFLALPEFSPRPRVEAMRAYLLEGPAEHEADTIFEGVQRLSAASLIYASPTSLLEGSAVETRWWTLDPNDSKEPHDPARAAGIAEAYREHLDEAVRVRLRADVKIGSALSGGLDSSSIVWFVAQQLREQGASGLQETFSSVYRSPGVEAYDESRFIEEVGSKLGVSVNTVEPKPADVPVEHERMIWALDTPPETTLMSSWHTFRLVNANGIKVTLDGQGADEQMAGYLYYLPHALAGRPLAEIFKTMFSLVGSHPNKMVWGSLALALLGRHAPASILANHRQRAAARMLPDGLNAHLKADCEGSLANLLHYADRTSMAFSVESRAPYLDFRLAEFLAGVPEAYKLHDGWTKHLARVAMDGRLPDNIAWRRDKMGWPTPDEVWAHGPLAAWFRKPREDGAMMRDFGLGSEFARALDSGSVTDRVRAINLAAWANLYMAGGWKGGVSNLGAKRRGPGT